MSWCQVDLVMLETQHLTHTLIKNDFIGESMRFLGRALHHIFSSVFVTPSVSLHLRYTNVCIMATERILRCDWLRSTHYYHTLKNNGTKSAVSRLNTMHSLR